jgi:hypothetical protein
MSDARPHPFALLFGAVAAERFPAIAAALGAERGLEPFLMAPDAIELLHALRPEGGLGDEVDDFGALVHAAWCYWADGEATLTLEAAATRMLCAADQTGDAVITPPVRTRYVAVEPRLVWAALGTGEHHEPLDGWFAVPVAGGLRVVACFGVHPARPGVSAVAVEGAMPGTLAREDGTPLFAPTMPGGDTAGLHAVAAPDELLLLAWRAAGMTTE